MKKEENQFLTEIDLVFFDFFRQAFSIFSSKLFSSRRMEEALS